MKKICTISRRNLKARHFKSKYNINRKGLRQIHDLRGGLFCPLFAECVCGSDGLTLQFFEKREVFSGKKKIQRLGKNLCLPSVRTSGLESFLARTESYSLFRAAELPY